MRSWRSGALLASLVLGTAGCRLESSQRGDGNQVRLMTPVGGLQVKTDAAAAEAGVGLPVFPGAVLVAKADGGKDNSSADINLSFGALRLRVKALHYQTDEAPEAVEAFYGKELGRFGVVIRCRGDRAVGEPTKTPEGLTCASDSHSGVHTDGGETMLKAGSPEHQHLVDVKARGAHGTDFGLIALDLPRQLVSDGDK